MIGSLMMRLSVVLLCIGMVGGIAMGVAENFELMPAHSHLNLVGGVLLFLFGLYYRLVPEAGASRLALIQGWLHMIGALLFPGGLAVMILAGHQYVFLTIIGSFIVLAAVALFAVIVFRTTQQPTTQSRPAG
jgi:hypothetical protein